MFKYAGTIILLWVNIVRVFTNLCILILSDMYFDTNTIKNTRMHSDVWDIYLTLYKTSCTRATKSMLFCRSFALSLYKTSFGSAVSSPVKLRFPALPLRSPRIVFV